MTQHYDFPTRYRLESTIGSSLRRSEIAKVPEKSFVYNVWKLKPPDFNPQIFEPTPPKRNSRDAIRPWTYDANTTTPSLEEMRENRRANTKRTDHLLQQLERQHSSIPPQTAPCGNSNRSMRLRFRIDDPHEARIRFVKTGCFKKPPYTNPKPHDHRGYPPLKALGLEEFKTSYDRDPYDGVGLKCKKKGIATITGPQADFLRHVRLKKKEDYEAIRHLKYDPALILPKLSYPNKMPAFTRHRRKDRSAKSAYLERAEDMMMKRKREIEEFKKRYKT